MANVVVMYGSQTFSNSSAKIHTYVMRRDGTHNKDFPDTLLKPVKASGSTMTPASTNGGDNHGAWYRKSYESKEGVVMGLTARTTRNGMPYNSGMVFVALRESGPLINIQVNLCPHRMATFDTINLFQGKGDVLTLEDLPDYGIKLSPNFIRNNLDEEELEELFTVGVLSAGEAKPKTVEVRKASGEKVRVQIAQEPVRRIRIRR